MAIKRSVAEADLDRGSAADDFGAMRGWSIASLSLDSYAPCSDLDPLFRSARRRSGARCTTARINSRAKRSSFPNNVNTQ